MCSSKTVTFASDGCIANFDYHCPSGALWTYYLSIAGKVPNNPTFVSTIMELGKITENMKFSTDREAFRFVDNNIGTWFPGMRVAESKVIKNVNLSSDCMILDEE